MLSLYLRGRRTKQTSAILGFLIFGMVVASAFLFRWFYAPLAFVLACCFVAISAPIARKVAFRILGYRTGYEQNSGHEIDDLLETGGMDHLLKKMVEKQDGERARLASIAGLSVIAGILQQHGLTQHDFEELHKLLIESHLPDIAWEILSTPDDLTKLIEFQKQGLEPREIYSKFRQGA